MPPRLKDAKIISTPMAISPQGAELLVKLLVYLGGVASTAVGALFASRVRVYEDNRKAHLEDIKGKILVPLRDGLGEHFRPLVFHLKPIVFVEAAATTEFRDKAKATESQIEQGDLLQGAFPSSLVYAPLDSALLQDVRKKHFVRQMSQVDRFIEDWLAYVSECHVWVRRMAEQILSRSGLHRFPNPERSTRGPAPYVMHYRVAAFVFRRLFRLSAPPLNTWNMNDGMNWALNGEDATLACGTEKSITALVADIDRLLESEKATGEMLRSKSAGLQKDFNKLIEELDYAIATRKLHKRCDLVPFF